MVRRALPVKQDEFEEDIKVKEAKERKQRVNRQQIMESMIAADPILKEKYEALCNEQFLGKPWMKHRKPDVPYDSELADVVLHLVSSGLSLAKISEMEGMPTAFAVINWTIRNDEFGRSYMRALVNKAQVWADEVMDIADDSRNDWIERERENGSTWLEFDHDHAKRVQLRVESRKWYLSKIMPKQFGDAALLKLADSEGNRLPSLAPSINLIGIARVRANAIEEEAE
jgi:hypothetical protein